LANKIKSAANQAQGIGSGAAAPGIYVHVPFCAHACDFCAFYQIEPRRPDIDLYFDAIAREFALVAPGPGSATAFWGGGTPGLLSARDLERLGRLQVDRFGVPTREWTVELAPGSVRPDKLRVLRDLGVTRVSLGIQSLNARLLDALGRRHSQSQIQKAWEAILAAGFPSKNLDLIFAIPGQSLEDWRSDLDAAVAMEPDHISTYCLTFEEDTALFVRLSAGKVSIDVERERAFYEAGWDQLEASGYLQYEISNFARPGHACLHNLNTWRMGEWWGFGPSAASQAAGVRGSNPADLVAWSEIVRRGARATEDSLRLSKAQLAEDAVIFGLRMNEGISLELLEQRFGGPAIDVFRPRLNDLIHAGLAEASGRERIRLTRAGRLVADAIGAEFVGTVDEGCGGFQAVDNSVCRISV